VSKLKELVLIKKGTKIEPLESGDDLIRFIQIDDLRNNENIKLCKSLNNYTKVTEKDVIIAWDGANAGTIGYGISGAIGSTLAKLEIINKNVCTQYLGILLQGKFHYLRSTCTGATIPHISRSALENIEIPLPPIEEQKKIAEILDKASNLIYLRKKQIEKLDLIVKSRFLEMFGDPVTNAMGWEAKQLGELCSISRGGSPRPIEKYLGGTVPWIKIGDATSGDDVYLRSTKENIIEAGVKKSRRVKSGSLIFANCGVSLGFARIITFDGCIHDGWLSFEEIDERLNKIFLLKSLNHCTEHFRRLAPEGTQPNLNTGIMKDYSQIVPPLTLQNTFANFVGQVDKSKFVLQQGLEKLELTYKALMQQYFN